MQEVQTLSRLGVPLTMACTVWMFGFQRRRVRRCECETLLPKPGPLPHTSQTEATVRSIDQGLTVTPPDRPAVAAYPIPGRSANRPAHPHPPTPSPVVSERFYAALCDHAPRAADP